MDKKQGFAPILIIIIAAIMIAGGAYVFVKNRAAQAPATISTSPTTIVTSTAPSTSPTSTSIVVASSTVHINSLSPSSGPIGTKVTIIGSGFTPANNKITFGDWPGVIASSVISQDGHTLTFTVPGTYNAQCPPQTLCTQLEAGDVYPTMRFDVVPDDGYPISVTNINGMDSAFFRVPEPPPETSTVTIHPDSGPAGSPFRLDHRGFPGSRFAEVHFSNTSGINIVAGNNVPKSLLPGVYRVYVLDCFGKGCEESSSTTFTVMASNPLPVPKIISISPSNISPGTIVTIKGTGFTTTTHKFGGRTYTDSLNEVGFGAFSGFLASFDGETIIFQMPEFVTGTAICADQASVTNAYGNSATSTFNVEVPSLRIRTSVLEDDCFVGTR